MRSSAATATIERRENQATIGRLQDKIDSIESKMGSVLRVVAETSVAVPEPARAILDDTQVPRASARKLSEALERSRTSSLQMRQALEVYERAATNNEALFHQAQAVLSDLLTGT